MEELGANLLFCRWNIGDPERTTTAVNRWYSFHGKFIITDKSAIALSANFTQEDEYDAVLIYKNHPQKVKEYLDKFDELISLFVQEYSGDPGKIKALVQTETGANESIFKLPNVIEGDTHANAWIRHYPDRMCPDRLNNHEGIFLAPFDVRGRSIYEKIIQAVPNDETIYLSAESFTDTEFAQFLLEQADRIDIKLLTDSKSQDFQRRIDQTFREMVAQNIEIKSLKEDLHAKLLITPDTLLVGSINLNKINLGFSVTSSFWRENTETFALCQENSIINKAIDDFQRIFQQAIPIESILSEKLEDYVTSLLNKNYNLRSRASVKKLFARVILSEEIKTKKLVYDISRMVSAVMSNYNVVTVNKNHFIMALILFYLSERKQDRAELSERISNFETGIILDTEIDSLLDLELIEESDGYYKINPLALLRR